jgi:hypothetical protein
MQKSIKKTELLDSKCNESALTLSDLQSANQGSDSNEQNIGVGDAQNFHFNFKVIEDFVISSKNTEEHWLGQLASVAKKRENDSRFAKLEDGGLNWSSNSVQGKDRLDILKADLHRLYNVEITAPKLSDKDWDRILYLMAEGKDRLANLQVSYSIDPNDPDDDDALDSRMLMAAIVAEDMFQNKQWTTLSKFSDTRYISCNEITLLNDMYVSNQKLKKKYRIRTLGEILELILSEQLKSIPKENRPQLYFVRDGSRPNNGMYDRWNGLQVFDLDLKNSNNFDISNQAQKEELKQNLYNHLCKYHWFVGIGYSSSGNGLHIYTKVFCCDYVETDQIEDLYKYWYRLSFVLKYAVIHYLLTEVCGVSNGIDSKKQVLDVAVGKISQGIRVAYDPQFLVNPNFEDMPIWAFAHIPPVEGLPLKAWLLKDDILKNRTFMGWEKEMSPPVMKSEKQLPIEEKVYEEMNVKLKNFEDKNVTPYNGRIYYKSRYHVCNTLAHLFGEKGRNYAHIILQSKKCSNISEINGMYSTALSRRKKATSWGLNIIGQCGIHYTVDKATQELLTNDAKKHVKSIIEGAITEPNPCECDAEISLKENQFLGDVSDELLKYVKSGKANLITAAPGTGKTEWVKSIAKEGKKILLVLPFISVIVTKIENDNEICELFDVYKENVSISNLKKDKSAVMTIDKFAQVPINNLLSRYDLIVVDESHLIFTSGYRLERMADALAKIKKCINESIDVDSPTKLLLMTGTPTGELDYFDYYKLLNHIHVTKPEQRTKQAEIILCRDNEERKASIAKGIADCIRNGKRVLYPTNGGDTRAAYLVGMVEYFLGRPVKWGYYKKARERDDIVQFINHDKTVRDKELILATNYLSAGIDINDRTGFTCIYDGSFAGFEIEQFNCRLRKQDIDSKIYIAINDDNGYAKTQLFNTTLFSIRMDDRDIRQTQNYMLIAGKKIELSYDPVTNEIETPGFREGYGRPKFVLEEHELFNYEKRYMTTMCAPYFVARSLGSYGYNVFVLDSPLNQMSMNEEKKLYEAAVAAAKAESMYQDMQRKNTFLWLLGYEEGKWVADCNRAGYIWGSRRDIKITEDYNLSSVMIMATDEYKHITVLEVPNLKMFDEYLKTIHQFLSCYSKETSKWLFEQCIARKKRGGNEGWGEEGKLDTSELHRYVALIEYIKKERKKDIRTIFANVLTYINSIIDVFYKDPYYSITAEEYKEYIEKCVDLYLNDLGKGYIVEDTQETYRKKIKELFKTIAIKSGYSDGIRLHYRPLPTQQNRAVYFKICLNKITL